MSSNWIRLQASLKSNGKRKSVKRSGERRKKSRRVIAGKNACAKKQRREGDSRKNLAIARSNEAPTPLWVLQSASDITNEDDAPRDRNNSGTNDACPSSPSVAEEIKRLKAMRRLRAAVDACYRRVGLERCSPATFESALLEDLNSRYVGTPKYTCTKRASAHSLPLTMKTMPKDPILPGAHWARKCVLPRLLSEGASADDAPNAADALQRILNELKTFERSTCSSPSKGPLPLVRVTRVDIQGKAARRAKLERTDPDLIAFDFECEDVRVRINSRHFRKMRSMFDRCKEAKEEGEARVSSSSAEEDDDRMFRRRLFCVLARYSALRGGGVHGGGMQAAAPEHVFEVLRRHFDASFECFASPLNCRYASYCSAFHDTDAPFGSVGSFWSFRPRRGSFQVNPPFDRAVIEQTAAHILDLLAAAEHGKSPLSFVVMIPTWRDAAGWTSLRDSKRFCRVHTVLERRAHGYCEGLQHSRPTRYRIAPHDTSVFVLQSSKGHKKWRPTAEYEAELRVAFRSKHVRTSEILAAKRRARSGAG